MSLRAALSRSAAPCLALATLAWAGCGGDREDARRPSVLLIVVDTLRADHLGCYGYAERPTSPRIDALAAEGVVFERAQSVSSWTLPSVATMLTGVLPSRHGAGVDRGEGADDGKATRARLRDSDTAFLALHPEVPTLAEAFAAQGWWTGAVVANNFLKPAFGMQRGFAAYEAGFPLEGDEVVERVLASFAERPGDAPFLFLAHFMDPHLPYDAAEPFRGRFTDGIESKMQLPVDQIRRLRRQAEFLPEKQRAFVTAAYDEEIASVDHQVGRLLDALEASGALADTWVVLTSDHGEELFEHGGFEHGHSMYQEVLHVPLIVAGPGLAPRRVATVVSLLDLAATLCDLAGVDPGALGGTSLAPLLRAGGAHREAVSEGTLYGEEQRALLSWPLKLATRETEAGTSAGAWDLERDPGETQRLPATAFEDALAALEERLARERAQRGAAPAAELDPEMLQQLNELGYTGD